MKKSFWTWFIGDHRLNGFGPIFKPCMLTSREEARPWISRLELSFSNRLKLSQTNVCDDHNVILEIKPIFICTITEQPIFIQSDQNMMVPQLISIFPLHHEFVWAYSEPVSRNQHWPHRKNKIGRGKIEISWGTVIFWSDCRTYFSRILSVPKRRTPKQTVVIGLFFFSRICLGVLCMGTLRIREK